MTMPRQYKERMAAIRKRTSDARGRRAELSEVLRFAREAGDHDAELLAEDQLKEINLDIEASTQLENVLLSQLAGVTSSGLAESALDDPNTIAMLEQLANNTSTPVGSVMLGQVVSRDDLMADFEQGRMMAAGFSYPNPTAPLSDGLARLGPSGGVIGQLRRRLRLLDLMPTMTVENKLFPYVQESGSLDTAAETAEAATAPEADQVLTDAEARVASIPHWIKVPREVLADVPGLATAITSRLTYGVQRRYEAQILAGDGVGENMLGILNTSGIGSVAFAAGTPLSDLTLSAITTVTLSDAEPNGVVANPLDVQEMLTVKATGSGERLDSGGGFSTPPDHLWGLPLIVSRVIPQGTALVGDFAQGATALIREGINVRISDSDQDDFLKRRVTTLAEMRGGVAIWQPTAFSIVHFA